MQYDPSKTAAYLAGIIDKLVKEQARKTIEDNARADGAHAKFARIADGDACDFCKMLATRGFVYASASAAGEGGTYHPFCNCQVAVRFEKPRGKSSHQSAKDDEAEAEALMDAISDLGESKYMEYAAAPSDGRHADGAVKWGSDPTSEEEVDSILDEAVENGAIRYEKSRSSKDMERDLFTHASLYRNGWGFTIPEEEDGNANLDMLRDNGEWWELKSPISDGGGKHPLRFVEGNLRVAKRQFALHQGTSAEDARVIFNTKYTAVSSDRIIEELSRLLKDEKYRMFKQVIVVREDGTLASLR